MSRPLFCASTGIVLAADVQQYEISKSQDGKSNCFILDSEVDDCSYYYDPSHIQDEFVTVNSNQPKLDPIQGDLDDLPDTKNRIKIRINYLLNSVGVLDGLYEQAKGVFEKFNHRKEALQLFLRHLLGEKFTQLCEKADRQELEEMGEEIREFQKQFKSADDLIELLKSAKYNRGDQTKEAPSSSTLFDVTDEDEKKLRDKYEVVSECLKIDKFIVRAIESSEEKIKAIENSEDSAKVLDLFESVSHLWEKVELWTELKKNIQETVAIQKNIRGELQSINYDLTLVEFIKKVQQKYRLVTSSLPEMQKLYSESNAFFTNVFKALHTSNVTIDTCLHSIHTYKEGGNLLRRLKFLSSLPKLYQIAMHEVVRRRQEFKKEKLEEHTMNMIESLFFVNCEYENQRREEFDKEVGKISTDPKDISELKKLVPGLIGERVNNKSLVNRLRQFMTTLLRPVDADLPNVNQLEEIDFFFVSPMQGNNNAIMFTDTNIGVNESMCVSKMTESVFMRHVSDNLSEVNKHIDEQIEQIKENDKDDPSSEKKTPIQQKHQELSDFYNNLMNAATSISVVKTGGRETELESEILKLRNELDRYKINVESLKFQLSEEQKNYQSQLQTKTSLLNRMERECDMLKKKCQDLDQQSIEYLKNIDSQKKQLETFAQKSKASQEIERQLEEVKKELLQQQELRGKNTTEEVKHLTLVNEASKIKLKSVEQQLQQSEQNYKLLQEQNAKKLKELEDKYQTASDNTQVQIRIIKTLKDAVDQERQKTKSLEQINLELKAEIDSLIQQCGKSSSHLTNKQTCVLSNIELGDRVLFFKVQSKQNKVLWQAFTTDTNKYYLSPETMEALQMYFQTNYNNQQSVLVNVIEITKDVGNPYQLDHPHMLVTAYINN